MKRIIAALILLTLETPAWAGFEDGEAAFNRKDYATAMRELRPLAEQGDAKAQYYLGRMYRSLTRGVKQDFAEAAKWFRKSAEQGHALAQHYLARHYYDGDGVAQDYAAAARWFRKAAEQGVGSAQRNLGYMYSQGRGKQQDRVQALKWYIIGALNGNKLARENRDFIEKKMTPAEIAEAQKLAREWWVAYQKRKDK